MGEIDGNNDALVWWSSSVSIDYKCNKSFRMATANVAKTTILWIKQWNASCDGWIICLYSQPLESFSFCWIIWNHNGHQATMSAEEASVYLLDIICQWQLFWIFSFFVPEKSSVSIFLLGNRHISEQKSSRTEIFSSWSLLKQKSSRTEIFSNIICFEQKSWH